MSEAATQAIIINALVKKYDKVTAVDGVSFSIKKGEMFGLLGPNGAGKTSTINCICQLASFSGGTITVCDHDVVKDYRAAKRKIGLSPQELTFDLYFSVIDTLVYTGGYFGMRKAAAEARAKDLLTQFGLWEKKSAMFRELSGGMKRKANIAKALMHDPDILILDEPTAGLDVESRYDLWEFIRNLNKQGTTIILTTHYIEEAHRLCERIGIIDRGKLVKIDLTKNIVDELSRNVIRLYAEKDLPAAAFKGFEHEVHARHVDVFVGKKEQSKVLETLLKRLEGKGLSNFSIEEDTLENIFRRLVNGK